LKRSYGVFLYVLYARKRPYGHINLQNDVQKAVIDGERLSAKDFEIQDEKLLLLFQRCLNTNASSRPTFDEIVRIVNDLYTSDINVNST
jgi:hypothetical protein